MKTQDSFAEPSLGAEQDSPEKPSPVEAPPLSVTQVTARIKRLFDTEDLRVVRVIGEISNFRHHLGKHIYFRLKDAGAQIACAFYHPANRRLTFSPRDGMEVIVSGYVSVYEARGEYQLYVRSLEESGMGALFRDLEELKRRLREEGLTSPERKRPLPAFPRRIGIVASSESAGLQDMLKALKRRYPLATVVIAPVAVEGVASGPSIAAGLKLMADHGRADVVITGRGGGSIESLWGFNTEIVARAIAAMPVPVIAAVGHETDTTVADLVADRRAMTPTEAVELATPDIGELIVRLRELERRCAQRAWTIRGRLMDRLRIVARSLRAPDRLWASRAERVARFGAALDAELDKRLAFGRERTQLLVGRVRARSPRHVLSSMTSRLAASRLAASTRIAARRAHAGRQAAVLYGRLTALNPTAVLARGYAVVMKEGRAVRYASELVGGDRLRLKLAEGEAAAMVLAGEAGEAGKTKLTVETEKKSGKARRGSVINQLGLFEREEKS